MTVRTDRDRAHETTRAPGDTRAKLLLVILCLIWGFTWPAMKVALNDIPPLSMRASTACLGALTMLLFCVVRRRSLRVSGAKAWTHVVIASLLNVVSFSLLSAFAQMEAATARVAFLSYTMPVWALLFAWAVLGEVPGRIQSVAIGLCAAGLAILISPVAVSGVPLGLMLAIVSGISWAAGTVYLKWAHIDGDPMGITSWQLTIAFFIIAASMFVFEGRLHLEAAHAEALIGVAFSGVVGNAIAYGIWFEVVRRLPAVTASLGLLGSPVVGVFASVLILGERPTTADFIGYALIFAASACVVLAPRSALPASG